MTTIHVIGLGVGETAELTQKAQFALDQSDLVIGSERQLATVSNMLNQQQTVILPKLDQLKKLLDDSHDKSVTVLASGDPLFYGIGKWLGKHFKGDICFYPAPSSIQYACHHLGLSLQDVQVISLHGRPVSCFRQSVRNHSDYLFLTDAINTPISIASEALNAGFENSELWVFERLGYSNQRVRHFTVQALLAHDDDIDPLNICYLKTAGKGRVCPEFPGISDDQFITGEESGKGMITKREVRLNILSLLQAEAKEIGWDVGAGCGSVAIEWGLWSKSEEIYAIEHHTERFDCILQNKTRFGVNNVTAINAYAPEALTDLPDPDAVFIGGSDGDLLNLMTYCWSRLKPQGRLVVSAVTENARMAMHQFLQGNPNAVSEMLEVSVKKAAKLGRQTVLRPTLPVTLLKIINDEK